MITISPLFALGIKMIGLTAVAAFLFTTNVAVAGPTRTFQSTDDDSFRVQIPEGWIIREIDNTGSTLEAEVREGFGILAQLCPEGQTRAQSTIPPNVGDAETNSPSCEGSQRERMYIIRYPNLDTSLSTNNAITNEGSTTKATGDKLRS